MNNIKLTEEDAVIEDLKICFRRLNINNNKKIIDSQDEWDQIFQKQKEFRIRNNITAGKIIDSLGMSKNMRQYLYSSKIKPSKRSDSAGYWLRVKLKEYLNLHEKSEAVSTEDDSTDNLLAEIESNNKEILTNNWISSLVFDENRILVIVNHTNSLSTIQNILYQINRDFFSKFEIIIDEFYPITYFGSPICTKKLLVQDLAHLLLH